MGLVTSLNCMDPQLKNLGLPDTWVLLFFGLLGLCCVITGGCIITLHWRKKLLRERRAQHWVEVIKSLHLHLQPTLVLGKYPKRYVINAAINRGPSLAVTNLEIKVQISEYLWEKDTTEGRSYGPRGSSSRAETPVAMQAALVVSHQPPSNQKSQLQIRSPFLIPNFPEIPFAPPLHKMPPMLERTASYPLDIYPERNVHYHSILKLTLE